MRNPIDAAKAAGRGAFVGYLPIGYPDLQTSIDAAVALAEAGADIIAPSDMMDGRVGALRPRSFTI